jgi:NodT family efflux transporter outer membrane factor (OMF) lipoprotein
MPSLAALLLGSLFAMLFMHAGCSVDSAPVADIVDVPEGFSASGRQDVPDRWWLAFEDAELNAIVHQVLESNFTARTAWQRLREAQAVVARESAGLYPAVDGYVDGEKTWTDSDDSKTFQIGLAAEYEVDLWGRVRSNLEAERQQVQARYADYQTVVLSLAAETVLTWYQLHEAAAQIELIRKQIETNEKVLDLLKTRFGSGQIRTTDLLRQERLLEATREQRIAAESRMGVLEHRLAILMGRPPRRDAAYAYHSLPDLPPLPKTGIPAELVRRRPDVRTAFHELRAADRRVAAAISDQYPRLTILASLYTADTDAADLYDDWVGSFAGSLVGPLFDAGRRRAEVRRTQAVKDQRLYSYGQAVLTAFQEVEDALILELKQRERLASLAEQAALAKETFERLNNEYLNGVSDYIDVLLALTNEQQLQRDMIAAHMTLLGYRIALYRALAGGFDTRREESL